MTKLCVKNNCISKTTSQVRDAKGINENETKKD